MSTAMYLVRAVSLIILGVIVANLILESTAMRKLSPLIRPFCRAANLPREGAIALFTAFFNSTTGKSTLAGFYHEGKISDRETILTLLMSTFPIVVGESLFRAQAPVALVLLGPVIGGIYLALTLLSAFLQSLGAFVYTKLWLPQQTCVADEQLHAETTGRSRQERTEIALKKSASTLKKVVPSMIIAFLIVDLLFVFGLMGQISSIFEPFLRVLDLPGEVVTALVAELAHFSAGYAIIAALLAKGVLTTGQAILTLLIGSIFTISMVYLKYSLPLYTSLFGRFGIKLTAITYLSSMVAKLIVILLVLALL